MRKFFGILSGLAMLVLPFASVHPALALSSALTEYTVNNGSGTPNGIAAGPDGNMWVAENDGDVSRIDLSGNVTRFATPSTTTDYDDSAPWDISAGPDGAMWFTDGGTNEIGRITTDGTITEYPVPTDQAELMGITKGPDGAMWFTEPQVNQIGRIDMSGNVTEYPMPVANEDPDAIAAGPDGNMWFVGFGGQVGKIDMSGNVTNYTITTAGSQPWGITAGPDGNMWFTETYANKIGRIDMSGNITEFPVPTAGSLPWGITTSSDGTMWFTEQTGANFAQLQTNGSITEYATLSYPNGGDGLTYLAQAPDGSIWGSENNQSQVERIDVTAPGPTDLTGATPSTSPALSWNALAGASSYNVYRNGTLIGSTTDTNYTDVDAPPKYDHYFVTAITNAGETAPTNGVEIIVPSTKSVFTSPSTVSTNLRQPFSFQITTTGSPAATITEDANMPPGVTFTNNGDGTATIAGTPQPGSAPVYQYNLTAFNGYDSPPNTQIFDLFVSSAPYAPSVISANSDTETFGMPMNFTVNTSGLPAPALTKTGALPAGVTFTDNGDGTATIAGTPQKSAIGVYTLTIKAKSTSGTDTQTFTLTITKAPVIKAIANKTLHVGTAMTAMTIKSSGYITPTLSVSPALPAGLSFIDNGDGTATISGTPQTGSGGSYALTVTAMNQLGSSTQTFTLKVNEGPVITSAANLSTTVGMAFSFTPTATGYPAPTFKETGALPKNVTFKNGVLSGTPNAGTAGTYNVTLTAKNTTGSVSQSFVLTVN